MFNDKDDNALSLIKLTASFLSDRTFKVKINNQLSESQTVSVRVPQGSNSGPTFFLVYINDMPENEKTKIA